jgi:endo-1,4-beta-xylanase
MEFNMTFFKQKRKLLAIFISVVLMTTLLLPVFTTSAEPFELHIGFEDGSTGGFEPREGFGEVTITDREAHTGTHSLLMTGRTNGWHGASINVTDLIVPGVTYQISIWVLPDNPESSRFRLSHQVGHGDLATYDNIEVETVSTEDGWVQLSGTRTFPDSNYITIYVENDTSTASFFVDDFSLTTLEDGGIPQASIDLPSLHERYKDFFLFGTAVSASDMTGRRFDLVERHFNVITAGNAMKPDALTRPERGEFRFDVADSLINPALEAGFDVIGHTLVWHSQSRDWLIADDDGEILTRSEARDNMENYINTVAGHFKGRVIAWDVVNEAFKDNVNSNFTNWRDELRTQNSTNNRNSWYRAYANGADVDAGECGSDYLYDAFVFTRIADPGAVLYYNDFNEEFLGKREAIAQMTEELNERWLDDPRNTEPDRLLIEGLGMQAHYWTSQLNPADVEATIVRWAQTGAEISITELDIPMGSWNNYLELNFKNEMRQAELYAELFLIFKKHADKIERVTIWGIDDVTSWRRPGAPLLFDEEGYAKYAFYAVLDPAGFLAGNFEGVKESGILPELTPFGPPTPTTPPETPPTDPDPTPDSPTPSLPPGDDNDIDDEGMPVILTVMLWSFGITLTIAAVLVLIIITRKKTN